MVTAVLADPLVLRAVDPPPLVLLALALSSWMVPTVWTNVLRDPSCKITVNAVPALPTAALAARLLTTACLAIVSLLS